MPHAVNPSSKKVPGISNEKTYRRLKAYVLSGKIEPGGRVHQEMCAEVLNVSRTPVREALQRLVSEGLVERYEDRGFRLVQLTIDELEELFDMRAVLEAFVMRTVCQRITDETIEKLSQWVEESEAALDRQDPEGIFQANTAFHNTLYSLIEDRKRFHAMLRNMKDHILRYRKQTLMQFDRARKSINAHKKIIFALKTRDPNLTGYLMRIHIQESKEDALEINFGIKNVGDASGGKKLMCMAIE
jgi:DNA-binding GntR family transcriptional regulator